jgi:hypothetical protein
MLKRWAIKGAGIVAVMALIVALAATGHRNDANEAAHAREGGEPSATRATADGGKSCGSAKARGVERMISDGIVCRAIPAR